MTSAQAQAQAALPEDGERFLPDRMHGDIELEHRHRYVIASRLVRGKRVLDIASGEGYGSHTLAGSAQQVTGVDVSPQAVAHASRRYAACNLQYRVGSCADIPLDDASVDAVVSFETIEHHTQHEEMMREVRRVLRPQGLLIISSPDKLEYSDRTSYQNPFHVKELYRDEFHGLLSGHFARVKLIGQRVVHGSLLQEESQAGQIDFCGRPSGDEAAAMESATFRPLYWIALASDGALPEVGTSLYEGSAPAGAPGATTPNITLLMKAVATSDSAALRDCLQSEWYRERNPDVTAAGIDVYQHWMAFGAREGRSPCSDPLRLLDLLMQERTDHASPEGRRIEANS